MDYFGNFSYYYFQGLHHTVLDEILAGTSGLILAGQSRFPHFAGITRGEMVYVLSLVGRHYHERGNIIERAPAGTQGKMDIVFHQPARYGGASCTARQSLWSL